MTVIIIRKYFLYLYNYKLNKMSPFKDQDLGQYQYYFKEIDILCHEEDDECFDKDIKTFLLYTFSDESFDFSFQEDLDKKYREEYYETEFIESILRGVFD